MLGAPLLPLKMASRCANGTIGKDQQAREHCRASLAILGGTPEGALRPFSFLRLEGQVSKDWPKVDSLARSAGLENRHCERLDRSPELTPVAASERSIAPSAAAMTALEVTGSR